MTRGLHFIRSSWIIWITIILLTLGSACSKDKDKDKKTDEKPAETIDLNEQNSETAANANVPQERNRHARRGERGRYPRERAQENQPANEPKPENAPPKQASADKPEPKPAKTTEEEFDFQDEEPVEDPVLEVAQLIEIKEFREMTGFQGPLAQGTLDGQDASLRYNAFRLVTDDSSQLGFALQVWEPGNENAALKRFQDLYTQSFGGSKVKDLGTDAFKAEHHQMRHICLYDRGKKAVIFLSCSDKICQFEQLTNIAKTIQRRL